MAPLFTGLRLGFGRSAEVAGPSVPFSATGGTKTPSGSDIIHTFTSTGPLQVVSAPPSFAVSYLLVGGGGGGGTVGGGGGAGG